MDYGDRLSIARAVLAMVLGSAVIIDALAGQATTGQWVAGLILLGIIPIDSVIGRFRRFRRDERGGDDQAQRQPN